MKLLLILSAFLGLWSLCKAQDCGGFIINDCQRDVCPFRNEEKVGSVDLCQLLCEFGSIGVEKCQSWAYHEDLQLCDLYGCPISDWISTCVEIGGTPEPSWEGCVQQQDGCQAYKGAICQLDSNYMLNQFQLLVSATECQIYCAADPQCQFFYFDDQYCTTYSKKDVVDCDVVAGPVSPKYGDCTGSVTTIHPTQPTQPPTPTPSTITPPTPSVEAELIIMVINAVTGNPILGVDVCYSCPELNIQACAATDSEGKLDAGKYPVNSLFNVTCTMEGYDSREDIIEVQADENVIPLNPKTGEDRFVLTWGRMPLDLDLHMVIYTTVDSPDCQVFFNHKNCTGARLDLDNTEGGNNGPETITVSDYNPDQKYMIYIHEFNHDIQNTLGKSGAKVTMYSPNLSNPKEVLVPNNGSSARYWLIGCIQGQDGLTSLKIIDQLMDINPVTDLSLCS